MDCLEIEKKKKNKYILPFFSQNKHVIVFFFNCGKMGIT